MSKLNRAPDKGNRATYKRWLLGLLPVALVIVLTICLVAFGGELKQFQSYGYAGVFLISLLSSATVVVPLPGLAIVFVMGSILNPALVGLAFGAGSAIGELSGYMAGYGGNVVIGAERWGRYRRLEDLVARKGILLIFVAAAIPNPVFDIAGMAAGALRMPLWKFLLACWLGKTVKGLLAAFGGYYGMNFLLRFI